MKKENKKADEVSNYREIQPKGKVDEGEKAVKKPEDEIYQKKPATAKAKNPAKTKEASEQPVHSVKK